MKKIIVLLMFLSLMGLAQADYAANYNSTKKAYAANKNYTTAWQFAKGAFFYGEYIVTDNEQRKVFLTEGKEAAQKSVELNANQPEGHYWLGVCSGAWAEANGVLNSLQLAGPIADEMTKVIALNPSFNKGSAYMVRGRVYSKAPGWPVSVGDGAKAEVDFKNALKYGPTNRKAYRNYAEYLIANGRKTEAAEMIKKGLAIAFDQNEFPAENREVGILKDLQTKIQ